MKSPWLMSDVELLAALKDCYRCGGSGTVYEQREDDLWPCTYSCDEEGCDLKLKAASVITRLKCEIKDLEEGWCSGRNT